MASSGESNNINIYNIDVEAKTFPVEDEEDSSHDVAHARRGEGAMASGNTDTENTRPTLTDAPKSQSRSYKQHESYAMSEDVYAFVIAADPASMPFLFAMGVIFTKYIVFGALLFDIVNEGLEALSGSKLPAIIVKALLVPVAIAMQSDLMAVYAAAANVRYDKEALTISKHATKFKYALAHFLQLIDGMASLGVNFSVMLQTDDTLGVLLNFAALHFLQDIDDIFYVLVEKGFFGDAMEEMTTLCKQISWPRRVDNSRVSNIITQLDTILFFFTFVVLFAVYLATTIIFSGFVM